MKECSYCGVNIDNSSKLCDKCTEMMCSNKYSNKLNLLRKTHSLTGSKVEQDKIEFEIEINGIKEKRYILKSEWELFNKFYEK